MISTARSVNIKRQDVTAQMPCWGRKKLCCGPQCPLMMELNLKNDWRTCH